MIDLNAKSFDSKEVIIFNGGKAGICENCAARVEEKKVDDKVGTPNIKIIFTDPNKGEVNRGEWDVSNATDPDKALTSLGVTAKHIFHTVYGPAYVIPPFKDDIDILNGIRNAINSNPGSRYRVAVDYGSEDYPKKYLSVKKFAPFMENMLVPKEETKLFLSRKALMKSIEPDSEPEAAAPSAPKSSWVVDSEPTDDKPAF
jgi:hypothetical protein